MKRVKKLSFRTGATRAAPAPEQKDEYATFESALKKVLIVSHKQIQKRIARASAARALNAKD